MLEKATDGDMKMQSKYHLYKPAKELVTDYKINITEFKPTFTPEVSAAGSTINAAATRQSTSTATAASSSSTSSSQVVSLTQNLMRDEENNNRIVFKSDSKTPDFCLERTNF